MVDELLAGDAGSEARLILLSPSNQQLYKLALVRDAPLPAQYPPAPSYALPPGAPAVLEGDAAALVGCLEGIRAALTERGLGGRPRDFLRVGHRVGSRPAL